MFARTRRTINSGRSMGRAARHLMQKFRILKPLKTHWRIATCSEVECQAHEKGFRTIVDKNSAQAGYIRGDFKINGFVSGRPYQEQITADNKAVFTFAPGTECFASHKVQIGKADVLVRQTIERKSILEPEQFIWLMNENHYAIKKALKEG